MNTLHQFKHNGLNQLQMGALSHTNLLSVLRNSPYSTCSPVIQDPQFNSL